MKTEKEYIKENGIWIDVFERLKNFHKEHPIQIGETVGNLDNLSKMWEVVDIIKDYILVRYTEKDGTEVNSKIPVDRAFNINTMIEFVMEKKESLRNNYHNN